MISQQEVKMPKTNFATQISATRAAALWLDEQVRAADGKVTGHVISLTPELADVLLERNEGNRAIRPKRVNTFAKDIANGAWKLNGEAVIVSANGLLNDGQHRCAAVIQAKMPIDVMFIIGPDRDTRDTLDQGVGRTPGDTFALHGFRNTNVMATAARMLFQWRTSGQIGHTSIIPTRAQLIKTAEDNPGLAKSVDFVSGRSTSKVLGSHSILGFCHFAFKSVANEIDANFFFDCLIDGADLAHDNPILYVRNRLIAERDKGRRAGVQEIRVELLFRAWNAHRLGETRKAIPAIGGELPLLQG